MTENTEGPTRVGVRAAQLLAEAEARRAAAPRCEQHPEFLRHRCDRCDQQRAADRLAWRQERLQAAITADCDRRFPARYVKAGVDNPAVQEWVNAYRADPAGAASLLLLGPTGVGKTHAAYGALRAALLCAVPRECPDAGRVEGRYDEEPLTTPRFAAVTSADLYASLRPRPGVDTEQVMADYRSADLLLLDDIGVAKNSEWTEETLYRLANGRYEQCRPLILTTNLPMAEVKNALGDRIASRLAETCTRVVLDGPDRRRSAA